MKRYPFHISVDLTVKQKGKKPKTFKECWWEIYEVVNFDKNDAVEVLIILTKDGRSYIFRTDDLKKGSY